MRHRQLPEEPTDLAVNCVTLSFQQSTCHSRICACLAKDTRRTDNVPVKHAHKVNGFAKSESNVMCVT